jgi:outer membrane protein
MLTFSPFGFFFENRADFHGKGCRAVSGRGGNGRTIMSSLPIRNRAYAFAAAALTAVTTPAAAQLVVPARVLPTPIIPPPFVAVPEIPDDDLVEDGRASDRLTLAVGAAVANDYEGSNNLILAPGAGGAARIDGHAIAWQGNSLGIDLVPEYRKPNFKFIFAPFINLNLNRTGTPRDPVMALVPRPGIAVEGGVVAGFTRKGVLTSRYDSLTVQVSSAYDLGSVHKSFIVTPSIAYTAPLSKAVAVVASTSFDVVGAGYARRYFGIDGDAGTASGLPLYRPGGGLKSGSVSLGGAVSLAGDLRHGWAIGAKLNFQRLLGEFADSPIVVLRGDPNQFSAAMGLAYTF